MRSATRRKTGKDKPYLTWLHTQECVAFERRLEVTGLLDISPCQGRITAHHAGDHGTSQKAPDRTAIPLCDWHHQNGPHAIHGALGRRWWAFFGLDRETVIAGLLRRYGVDPENGAASSPRTVVEAKAKD